MRSHLEIISQLTRPGIIAVVRTDQPEQIPPICQALLAGRVTAIEITLTVPNALEAISQATRQFGATVLNAAAGRAAIAAGAEFIVSPISRPEIVAAAHGADRPVMLGAYTPTEAQIAHEAGA